MSHTRQMIVLAAWGAFAFAPAVAEEAKAPIDPTTRIEDPAQHRRRGPQNSPFRAESHREFVLHQLDVRLGDVVVDVGAGDGFWTEQLARRVGADGTVWAAEVGQKQVDALSKRFASTPPVKARLIPANHLDLPDSSIDLAFFSLVYHHLPDDKAGYLRRLHQVMKPTGRLAIIERYSILLSDPQVHGAPISKVLEAAESAGWVLVRYDLMPGTNHYLSIFARRELFDEDKSPPKKSDAK